MTALLLKRIDHMHVVELDRDLVARLEKAFPREKLTIHSGDALKFDFGQIPVPEGQKLRVVGNLPYNISSPLLFHLADFAHLIEDQHFMLQKEVVERMVAEPGSKVYGRLSVMLQWRYDMSLLFIVPPTAFDPPPKVESAIVRMVPTRAQAGLRRRHAGSGGDQGVLAAPQGDPQLRGRACSPKRSWSKRASIPQTRPETVGLEQYVALANLLKPV